MIAADGRSRAYINGTPTPLAEVRELGERLISIHSQHEHQALLKKEAHRQLLDNYADARELAATVREHWRAWQKARRAHDDALNQAREQNEREELLRFQLEELDALALQEGELAELEQEQQRLANADSLIRICQQSLNALYEGDDGTCNDHLSQVSHWLDDARRQDEGLGSVADAVESARLQVEAAAEDLRHYLERLDLDPERLNLVEERLSQCYTLARKYRIRPEELVEHHQSLLNESEALGNVDAHLHALAEAESSAEKQYMDSALKLGKARRSAGKTLTQRFLASLFLRARAIRLMAFFDNRGFLTELLVVLVLDTDATFVVVVLSSSGSSWSWTFFRLPFALLVSADSFTFMIMFRFNRQSQSQSCVVTC